MIREAGPEDAAVVEAILLRNVGAAMFPLSNLRAHGLARGGFAGDHPHAMRVWLTAGGGFVALTKSGMLMPLLADKDMPAGLRAELAGHSVTGAIGPVASVRPVLSGLGLDERPTRINDDEPGFALDLADLKVPDLPGSTLVAASADLRPQLVAWRSAYHREVLGTPDVEAQAQAPRDVEGWLAQGSHRVLMQDGQPVAVTGFNADLPEIVQVGGVYAPPALRGRGLARRAVALHLDEAHKAGVRRAVLFAISPAAARAYAAIGFRPAQPFALVLFTTPVLMTP